MFSQTVRCKTSDDKNITIRDTTNILNCLKSILTPQELDSSSIITAVNDKNIHLLVSYFTAAELQTAGINFTEIQEEKSKANWITPNMNQQQPSSEEKTKHVDPNNPDNLKNPACDIAHINIKVL